MHLKTVTKASSLGRASEEYEWFVSQTDRRIEDRSRVGEVL